MRDFAGTMNLTFSLLRKVRVYVGEEEKERKNLSEFCSFVRQPKAGIYAAAVVYILTD